MLATINMINHKVLFVFCAGDVEMTRCFGKVMLYVYSFVSISPLAFSCPPGQREIFGVCLPEFGGAVGEWESYLNGQIPGDTLGDILEKWIISSRDAALADSMPIPPLIRQALAGYIENDIMNMARFKIGDSGVTNLAGLSVRYGDANAVTLIDVIVFRNADSANNDAALWAHELTHVKQYRDFGVHDFAVRYVRNYHEIEDPAYSVQFQFAAWRASHPVEPPP